ncbi:MAG TPA: GAF domain-containing sensor histidine kinase [Acidimicrobiia bacterium]|nr:GAF domain-containing sensor histidine kinase [Acidimicrobiia bacterium]HZQ77731.1 GAF domain-containing sensor histidine kinase [Acidimicrobiia bacterium]
MEVTSSDLNLREVAEHVAVLVTEATASDVCFVHVLDEARGRLVLMGATPPFTDLSGTVELGLGEGVAGWVALHAEPAVVPDKWQDDRYVYIPALRGEDYESLVSVPLLGRGQHVVGVLNVHARRPRRYGDLDVALLAQVGNLLARTIENARLYERLAAREQTLEQFAARTIDAQELERRRLAGEIHDGISQRLISLWYHLQAAGANTSDPAALARELAAAEDLTSAALDEARRAIAGLRPSVLDDLGLGPSLESLAHSVAGLDVDVDAEPCRLPAHVEVALYRIAQEALQNVMKHAAARRVTVRLSETAAGGVRLVVEDDGVGFHPAERRGGGPSYGLVGMRERAELVGATLQVTSAAGTGTRVEVELAAPSSRQRSTTRAE